MQQPTITNSFHHTSKWRKLISAPFIYGMIIPSVIIHITAEIYHQVCFRLYGIALLKVQKYIVIDRHKLSQLTLLQKINCMYCGYINGLYTYLVALARKTEEYWCAIKHADVDVQKVQHQQAYFISRETYK